VEVSEGDGMNGMNGTVIVGLDGSTAAARALHWAWDLARATGRQLRVVHTWRGDVAAAYVSVADLRREQEIRARQDAQEWLADAGVLDDDSVRWALEVVEGPPGPTLVRAAAEQDDCVLVVGTHEHHGLGRVLHGSVSHYVLSHATCPVVAVPPPGPELVTVHADPSVQSVEMPDVPRF
jgi:nucleotide-binding universal stress UspA family protein